METELIHKVFGCRAENFEAIALEVFRFQYRQNPVYRSFTDALAIDPTAVGQLQQIPFLPIRFFKSHSVQSTPFEAKYIFESSGTTGSVNSQHFVNDINLYHQSFLEGFRQFYGDPAEWCIIGLLPSYLERKNSSLVYMVNELVKLSSHEKSGFYLNEYEKLWKALQELEARGQRTLLIGVTFALLDFAEQYPLTLKNTVVMETGGMKGRREEMTRQEVHGILEVAFGIAAVHSEYGMTELLSQAYSKENGIFSCPPWMKILVREEDDPLRIVLPQRLLTEKSTASGIINIIDLANIYSCSFIATDDAGKLYSDGSFEVTGRVDNSDIRGCSLMVSHLK